MREDDDFEWPETDSDKGYGEPEDTDLWSDEDTYDSSENTFSGAGKSAYKFEDDDERRYARRSHSDDRRLPWWVFVAGAVLIILFIFIGIRISSCSNKTSQTSTSAAANAALEAKVSNTLSQMTTEEKVAQLFFVLPEQLTGDEVTTSAGEQMQATLSATDVGGVVYLSRNIESADQLRALISGTESYSKYPLFIGTFEEGGTQMSELATSGALGVAATDDAATIGASGNSSNAYATAHAIGAYLKDYGFNVNFAPLANVATDPNNTEGTRIFSSDATVVADMVEKEVAAYQAQGVSATLKHFPGIGGIKTDPRTSLGYIDKNLDELTQTEFVPFQSGIDAGADFVMVANVAMPGVTGNYVPASLSSQMVTDVLRGQLGFDGIVISDTMNEGAITENYTSGEAAVAFIEAGGDMILMPADFNGAYSSVLAAVQSGQISEDRLNESVTRILRVKLAS